MGEGHALRACDVGGAREAGSTILLGHPRGVWGFGTREVLTLSVVRVRPCVLLRLWCYWYIAP